MLIFLSHYRRQQQNAKHIFENLSGNVSKIYKIWIKFGGNV